MAVSISTPAGTARSPGLSPTAAITVAAGVVLLTGLIAQRYSPTPNHPSTLNWYRRLEKPGFTPPEPVMGIGWGVTETLLAIGGYRLLRLPSGPERKLALVFWALNFATIAGWAKLFFGERDLGGSLADVEAELVAAVGYLATAARVDGPAAALGVPYVAWAAFGTALDEEVWRRNRDRQPS